MPTLKLTLAYDGTAYAGWQAQAGRTSVQSELETAVRAVTGEHVRTLASGRTDAGVHALGQVVSLRTECRLPPDVLSRAINANLPDDITVLDAAVAPASFHPIRDACSKRYRYVIHDGPMRDVFARRYCWQRHVRLDDEAMRRAAEPLRGTHDFRSFQTAGSPRKNTVRTIADIGIWRGQGREANRVTLEVEADGFLYNMVRAIVGSLVEVGRGARPESWIAEVLAAMDRRRAGPTAPPQGLFLIGVKYESSATEPHDPGQVPSHS